MFKRLKISHHKHTGKLIQHQHTSYPILAVLLLFTGIVLAGVTSLYETAYADHPAPQAGSIGLYGKVTAKPPTEGAVITSPGDGTRFTTTPVTVKGTCPNGVLVEIYKSDIFAGSTFCENGKFTIDIDLLYGQNVLVARVYDAANQQGPDSPAVNVFFDSNLGKGFGLANLDLGGAQLLLNSDAVYRGIFPGKEMAFNLIVIGGRAPYAVSIDWGDSSPNTLVPRGSSGSFMTPHTYKKPGVYYISVKATDADGRVAFITVAAIVNGQPDPVAETTSEQPASPSILLNLWPLYLALIVLVTSFYAGERHEKKVLERHGQLIQTN